VAIASKRFCLLVFLADVVDIAVLSLSLGALEVDKAEGGNPRWTGCTTEETELGVVETRWLPQSTETVRGDLDSERCDFEVDSCCKEEHL